MSFQNSRSRFTSFSFVQFSRSCSLFASRVTAYLLYLMKFRLSRTFLRFFWSFSRSSGASESLQRLLLCGFSGCLCRSRAGQLDYNTTGEPVCQHLFSDFLTFFSVHFWLFGTAWFFAFLCLQGYFCYYIRYKGRIVQRFYLRFDRQGLILVNRSLELGGHGHDEDLPHEG